MRRGYEIYVHEGSDDIATIEMLGDLTASAEMDVEAAYRRAISNNPSRMVLEFDDINRINSTGIAILINLVMENRKNGCRTFISGLPKHFRKIFELVGLIRYVEIIDSLEYIAADPSWET